MAKMEFLKDLPPLKTGDLLLFSGKGNIPRVIKAVTLNRWSHVGIVISTPESSEPLLYESTHCNKLKCRYTGVHHSGVQLFSFNDRYEMYPGKVAVRQLQGLELNETDYSAIKNTMELLKGKHFEVSKRQLLKAAYDGPMGQNERDLSTVFCSELVAEVLMALAMLDANDGPSNEYVPADFASKKLHVLRGHYGPLQRIK